MSSAGQQLLAGRIPGERIETSIATADGSDFTTTETDLMSVTAPLVSGRTYRVVFHGAIRSDTTGTETVLVRIREDSTVGNQLQTRQFELPLNSSIGFGVHVEVEFTASSTGNKTFVATGDRNAGTGTYALDANSSQPAYLYVDYIRD